MIRPLRSLVAALVLAPGLAAAQGPLDGTDVPSGTLIVAGMAAEEVWLVDLPSGSRRAVIPTRTAPHEVAVSSDGRTAVVTNYGGQQAAGNLIQVLDVAAGTVVRELVVEGYERIHGAAFLPGDSLLVVTSERTGELLVVGVDDGAVRRSLPTEGRATHMLAPGGEWIYAANILDGTVSRVDPSGARPTLVWPAGTTRTEGIAATPDGSEGWTGSMEGGDVVGIEGATGRVVARIEGLQVPYRLAVTSDGATVVVTDPEAQQVVLVDRAEGAVRARVDVAAAAAAAGMPGGTSPQGFVLSPDGRWAFVSTKGIDRVTVVDVAGGRVVGLLEAPAGPDGIAFSPVGGGAGSGGTPAEAAIRAVLDALVAAWNDDDMEGHVAGYAADATYTVGDGLRRGPEAIVETLGGFRTPDGLYGDLRFEDVGVRLLGAEHALVTGRYVLTEEGQADRSGRFTLVMASTPDGWRAIHDQSS